MFRNKLRSMAMKRCFIWLPLVLLLLFVGCMPGSAAHTTAAQTLQMYIEHINEVRQNEDWDDECGEMSLIYIDDDDIPELAIDWGFTAGGSQVCAVSGGELIEAYAGAGGVSYIERQSIFLDSGGRMGNNYDSVYVMRNGGFEILHSGEYGEEATNDEENPYTYYWRWQGEDVTESEYGEKLASVFDGTKAVDSGVNACSAVDMLKKINELLSGSGSDTVNSNIGEIFYNSIPVIQLIGQPIEDVTKVFGNPKEKDSWQGSYYYSYGDITFFYPVDEDEGTGIMAISINNPGAFEINGVTLDKNRTELIKLLGAPSYEDEFYSEHDDENGYVMNYYRADHLVSFTMPTKNDKVAEIEIWDSELLQDDTAEESASGDSASGESVAVESSPVEYTSGTEANVKGLWLKCPVFPKDAEVIVFKDDEDLGTEYARLVDSMLVFTIRRQKIEESELRNPDDVQSLIEMRVNNYDIDEDRIKANMESIKIVKDAAELAQIYTYPCATAEYITGANEDTRKNVSLFIFTDVYCFHVEVSIAADWAEDYEESIAEWFKGLEFVE